MIFNAINIFIIFTASCPEGFIPDKEGKFGCFHFGGENQLMDWNEAKEFCSGLHQSSRLVEPFSKDMIDAIGAIFPYESPKPGGYRPYNYTGLGWIGVYQDAVSVIIDDASFIG